MGVNDIVTRLRQWAIATDAVPASDLMDEAAGEIKRLRSEVERLKERVNEFIDEERQHIMEHNPIRYDMNDPIFSEDAYE
jgi:regulator of replication initiation timing